MGEDRHREGDEQQSEEQARHEREAELHALAGSSPPAAVAAPTAPAPHPRPRRRLLFALLLVCVVIAGGVGWWRLSQHPRAVAASPLILRFPDGHIHCPESVDWSPDGAMVAVFGDSRCPEVAYNKKVPPDPQVELYDAASWRMVKDLHLLPLAEATRSQVLSPQHHADAATLAQVAVQVAFGVDWSPDSQELRIGFGLDASKLVATGDASIPTWMGGITINARSFATATTLAPQPPLPVAPPFQGSQFLLSAQPARALRSAHRHGTLLRPPAGPGLSLGRAGSPGGHHAAAGLEQRARRAAAGAGGRSSLRLELYDLAAGGCRTGDLV